RYWLALVIPENLERHRGFDIVMVSERDDRIEPHALDLCLFHNPGVVGPKRRSPPRTSQVEGRSVHLAISAFSITNSRSQEWNAPGRLINEGQTLARMQCVTVERYSGVKSRAGWGPGPMRVDAR